VEHLVRSGDLDTARSLLHHAGRLWRPSTLWDIVPSPMMVQPLQRATVTDHLRDAVEDRIDISLDQVLDRSRWNAPAIWKANYGPSLVSSACRPQPWAEFCERISTVQSYCGKTPAFTHEHGHPVGTQAPATTATGSSDGTVHNH